MKSFPRVKASLLLMVLLISIVLSFAPTHAQAKLITYESVLQISYDSAASNSAVFQPDGTPVSIPINVSFKVEVPEKFMSNILLRILFLQTFIITSAQITLDFAEEPPSWASFSIANKDVYVDISTETQYVKTALIIAPHAAAPSQEFTVRLKATTQTLLNKHVASKTAYLEIPFKPGYIPLINIETDTPSRIIGPQETTSFNIRITNLGNKQTLVSARVIGYPEGWSPLLPQSQILIPSASEAGEGNNVATMTFSITPPFGAGWHNEQETITIEFTPQFSPPIPGKNLTGAPIDFQVTVRNRGFSTPGFEIVGLLAALIIVAVLIKKRKKSDY